MFYHAEMSLLKMLCPITQQLVGFILVLLVVLWGDAKLKTSLILLSAVSHYIGVLLLVGIQNPPSGTRHDPTRPSAT